MSLVEIKQYGNRYLVFNVKDVERLRKEFRIVGALCGTLPGFPQQNTFYGLPLSLSLEEVKMVIDLKVAKVTNALSPLPSINNSLFRYFWSLDYYVTSGYKFGGDYLLYPQDPTCCHSQFIVSVMHFDQNITTKDVVQMGRLATNVKKKFVLAGFKNETEDEIAVFSLSWAGF
ncbi:tRNA-intron endonuclease catalytic domain-like protein [Rhizopus microsporus var. microsporus]|uniref:tRNA-intron lyase n=1 Tax=Rhizopus microsporus var. microsporus TaxID=86635 RepID=A0A1X0RGR7_RHIZD|nr:tRNA-intron endonuclease catalytic domain-like protein [Rhizopus microsporus var. microsporus]